MEFEILPEQDKPSAMMTMLRNDYAVSIWGTDCEVILPREIFKCIRDGVLVGVGSRKPMEMDGYSLYLALKALEARSEADFTNERNLIVQAALRRLEECNGFWCHGMWTGSDYEVHLRFTSAAIKLLTEGIVDGIITDKGIVIETLFKHLSYLDRTCYGDWFLHDSLEQPDSPIKQVGRNSRNMAWGSSPSNCLVLNTHVDTLVTVLNFLGRVPLDEPTRTPLIRKIESGTATLRGVLMQQIPELGLRFGRIDAAIRAFLFAHYGGENKSNQVSKRLVKGIYYRLRRRARCHWPFFVFPDGYIERDISLEGWYFEYHLINAWDLAKFALQCTVTGVISDSSLIHYCRKVVEAAIDYAIQGSYWDYVTFSMNKNSVAIAICETVLARIAMEPQWRPPPSWVSAYVKIRKRLPPSAALLGYDPVITSTPSKWDLSSSKDVLILNGQVEVTVDIEQNNIQVRQIQ